MRIGIIVGSVRDGRRGGEVAHWVRELAQERADADFELLDLRSFEVPLLTTATMPMTAGKTYESPGVQAWSAAVDACDGFVLVTPEYNHGVPGALKNAVDSLGPEWVGKTVGFVSYGGEGGVRSVEQWRTILANFQMVAVRAQVALSLFQDFDESGLTPQDRRPHELTSMLDQLVSLTHRLRG